MGDPGLNQTTPRLRLVVDNADPRTVLLPILEVERRLGAIERELRRPALAPDTRAALLSMQALLRCELDARPFNPGLARRCEHRLRWVERSLAPGRNGRPESLLARVRVALGTILPSPTASGWGRIVS